MEIQQQQQHEDIQQDYVDNVFESLPIDASPMGTLYGYSTALPHPTCSVIFIEDARFLRKKPVHGIDDLALHLATDTTMVTDVRFDLKKCSYILRLSFTIGVERLDCFLLDEEEQKEPTIEGYACGIKLSLRFEFFDQVAVPSLPLRKKRARRATPVVHQFETNQHRLLEVQQGVPISEDKREWEFPLRFLMSPKKACCCSKKHPKGSLRTSLEVQLIRGQSYVNIPTEPFSIPFRFRSRNPASYEKQSLKRKRQEQEEEEETLRSIRNLGLGDTESEDVAALMRELEMTCLLPSPIRQAYFILPSSACAPREVMLVWGEEMLDIVKSQVEQFGREHRERVFLLKGGTRCSELQYEPIQYHMWRIFLPTPTIPSSSLSEQYSLSIPNLCCQESLLVV